MPNVSIRGIGAPTPSGSSITDAWVEYQRARTTEVPAGEIFEIYAAFTARNPNALSWEVLVTAKSNDGSIAVYNPTDAYGDPFTQTKCQVSSTAVPGFSAPPIMPNRNITLAIKLWGNDTRGQPIPGISEW